MRNIDLREQSKSPDYQVSIRSQKSINSAVSFHIKTENEQNHREEDHRSPEYARSELRETWQRPRILHHGLPDVFNHKQKKKYGEQGKKDIIKMVENSKYKKAQKQLEPLHYRKIRFAKIL